MDWKKWKSALFGQKSDPNERVIYGVTDRSNLPIWQKINDFLIDHSPITKKEKGLFFHSLQMLVQSGVSFTRSLEILASRSRNPHFRRVLHTIAYEMQHKGFSFSQSLEKFPQIFSRSESRMIYSGEIAGQLEKTLTSIAGQIRKNLELEIRVRSALMYPATVFGAIILAGVVVMLFVVPKFTVLFAEFSGNLPLSTQILVGISDFLAKFWWLVFLGFLLAAAAFKSWTKSEIGGKKWDTFLLQMPILGSLVNQIQVVRIAENLSNLMRSGVPVPTALHLLGEMMPNRAIGDSIFGVEMGARKGKILSECFDADQNFDPILGEVIRVGEKGGTIPEILEKTGTQYQMEVDAQLKNLTTLIEPLVIFLVGGAVVFMASAIMAPIFRMQELLGG